MAREKSGLLWCLRTVFVGDILLPSIPELNSYVIVRCSASDLDNGLPLRAYSGWKSVDKYDTCASVFVVLFNGFMSLTSYFDVMYRY